MSSARQGRTVEWTCSRRGCGLPSYSCTTGGCRAATSLSCGGSSRGAHGHSGTPPEPAGSLECLADSKQGAAPTPGVRVTWACPRSPCPLSGSDPSPVLFLDQPQEGVCGGGGVQWEPVRRTGRGWGSCPPPPSLPLTSLPSRGEVASVAPAGRRGQGHWVSSKWPGLSAACPSAPTLAAHGRTPGSQTQPYAGLAR